MTNQKSGKTETNLEPELSFEFIETFLASKGLSVVQFMTKTVAIEFSGINPIVATDCVSGERLDFIMSKGNSATYDHSMEIFLQATKMYARNAGCEYVANIKINEDRSYCRSSWHLGTVTATGLKRKE